MVVRRYPPGSEAARNRGCTCPVLDNEFGKGWMGIEGKYVIAEGCPLHDEALKKRLADAEEPWE